MSMKRMKKLVALINQNDTDTFSNFFSPPTVQRPTYYRSAPLPVVSPTEFSTKSKKLKSSEDRSKQHTNQNFNANMFLPICKSDMNNNSRRSNLTIKAKQNNAINRKKSKQQLAKKLKKQNSSIKTSRQKTTNMKRSRQSKNNREQLTEQKRTRSSANRRKSHRPIDKRKQSRAAISTQQQQYKRKATTIDKPQSTGNRKRSMMAFYQQPDGNEKSRGNSPTRTGPQRRPISLTKTPATQTSHPRSKQVPEAKQHTFEKRDRTTSLMALQALAEKIAIYREKYGDIETRHSSIVAPPKRRKRQKQR